MNQLAIPALAPRLAVCSFVVDGEPIPCGRPRASIGKSKAGKSFVHVYADPRSAGYEKLIGQMALANRALEWRTDWAAYSLRIRVYQAERRGDGDNFLKAVQDGLQGVLWGNDRRIRHATVDVFDDFDRPRLEVLAAMVGPLDEQHDRDERRRVLAARARRAGTTRRRAA